MAIKISPITSQIGSLHSMARNTNGSGFSLKDELFNKAKVEKLAAGFVVADTNFDAKQFVKDVVRKFPELELKARIGHIADVLEKYLDSDFEVAAKQIVAALPQPLDPTKTDDDFGDFIYAPLGEYLRRHGCTKKYLKLALQTLQEITQRFSMEDAIRFFINDFPDETFKQLAQWSTDENYHVRRLASEGTRPLLPWSGRLTTTIDRPIAILDTLHGDPTRYVTRSVANHLNDIAKIEPDLVIKTLKRWHKVSQQDATELAWMTKHALRTLVKQGNADALALLGYKPNPKIVVKNLSIDRKVVQVGEVLEFSFDITAQADESLLVDYVIDFVKANGQTKPKVHKLKTLQLAAGETVKIEKRHPFKTGATTLTYYDGNHRLTLQINGRAYDSVDFRLTH